MKYFALPGDFDKATDFWDEADTDFPTCRDMDKSGGKPTCDGDGDGTIDANYEMFLFWHHLANAGLITGTYQGRSDPAICTNCWAHTPGITSPTGHANFQQLVPR